MRRERLALRAIVVAIGALAWQEALPNPTGGKVAAGQGTISQSGSALTVTQSSQNLSLNWQSFSIAPSESVRFAQPNASSIALNRVLGSNASAIYGSLRANGQVFLINPNGVLFGPSAQVDVGGLAASTLNLSDSDFLAGRRTFSGSGGSVVNQGAINATNGYVALIGREASNQGTITARLGTVALAAGDQVTLDLSGDHLINVQVDRSALNALAQNKQLIQADGGKVIMSTGAKDALLNTVVNNDGVVQARTLESHNGQIVLLGGMESGVARVNGTLDASAPNGGDGGTIETSAAQVKVADLAVITTAAASGKTGTWLIDPQDYTVRRGGDITGSALGANLGTSNVTIQSSSGKHKGSGDINVDDVVSWSANTTLTMTASNNVNVNANISATGSSAGIAINPNTANGGEVASGTGQFNLARDATINLPNVSPTSTTALVIGGRSYTVINSLGSLQDINANTNGNYALGSNIDASASAFTPISDFGGTFEGLNHTITGLTISGTGLFARAGVTANIADVGLVDEDVSNLSGTITGGLVGENAGVVSNSYTTGIVSGNISSAGGLVGANDASGRISRSYSTADAVGRSGAGGLVLGNAGSISESYSTGRVFSRFGSGGLALANSGTISNSYSTASVTADVGPTGGLVADNSGTITKSYSTGAVSAAIIAAGGLVAFNTGTVSDSFWDIQTSGLTTSAGGVGLTTKEMQTRSTFTKAGWDFENIWTIKGRSYPQLRAFLPAKGVEH